MRISILRPNGTIVNYIVESEQDIPQVEEVEQTFRLVEQVAEVYDFCGEDELEAYVQLMQMKES